MSSFIVEAFISFLPAKETMFIYLSSEIVNNFQIKMIKK
jgi:hypothetical protein